MSDKRDAREIAGGNAILEAALLGKMTGEKAFRQTEIFHDEIKRLEEHLADLRHTEQMARMQLEQQMLEYSGLLKDRTEEVGRLRHELKMIRFDLAQLQDTEDHMDTKQAALENAVHNVGTAIKLRSVAIKSFLPPPTIPGQETDAEVRVAVAFAKVEGYSDIFEKVEPDVLRAANAVLVDVIESSARELRGAIVTAASSSWQVAFHDPDAALRWALSVQLQMLYAKWPDALLEHPMAQIVRDSEDEIIFRGYRLSMSVAYENALVQLSDDGAETLVGRGITRAEKVCAASHGGQILMTAYMWKSVQDRLSHFGQVRTVDLGMHRLEGEDTDELLVSIKPDKLKNRKFPIPRTARPPTELIRQHMNRLRDLVENFEKTYQYNKRKQATNTKGGVAVSLRIDEMLTNFNRHQRLLLLKELKSLIESIVGQSPIGERYTESENVEKEVTKRMNAMDDVLDNVSNQLTILPQLEKRIERLLDEKAELYAALQRERADYLKELAECGEHMRSYAKNHTDVEFVLESLRVWSRRDQLRLNDVYAPTFKDPRDMPDRFSSLNLAEGASDGGDQSVRSSKPGSRHTSKHTTPVTPRKGRQSQGASRTSSHRAGSTKSASSRR